VNEGIDAITSFIYMYIQGIFEGTASIGYFYGNPEAIGNQIYPTGLSKYYDMYSVVGFFKFLREFLIAYMAFLISNVAANSITIGGTPGVILSFAVRFLYPLVFPAVTGK
jgi:hypothetical protein